MQINCQTTGQIKDRTAQPASRSGPGAEGESGGLLPALTILILGLGALTVATAFSDGVEGQYVVVAAPGAAQNDVIALVVAADGALVAPGGVAQIVIAASLDPEFPARARAAGAWAVFPAPRFLGCETPTEGNT